MNLQSNSNFPWWATIKNSKRKERPAALLFSGFLVAFFGVSGIQTSISGSFDTEQLSVTNNTPVCEQHVGMQAIIDDSALQTATKEPVTVKEMSPECAQEEKIKAALSTELPLSQVAEAEDPNTKAEQEQEKIYQERVASFEKLLAGHPIAKMSKSIAKQDPEIAALIVGIARKESQWGVHSPRKNGDCFNYWGFKGAGDRGTGMGYACFATREEAIEKIASRLEKMVAKRGTSKPSALVTSWKCGNSCATHSKESVNKWVSDVNQYYTKVLALK